MSQWIVPIVVAFISPFFIYLAAARKLSGRINTTEAAELWREAGLLRDEYRRRAEQCEEQIRELRGELSTVIARNTTLRRENSRLRRELRDALADTT